MTARLKPKEELFCYYYAKLRNSMEAAIKAGFPKFTAEIYGDRLLMRDVVKKRIREIGDHEQNDELMQCIISGLKRLAFSPTSDSIKLAVTNRDELNIDKLDLFHVSEIKIPKENSIEIKFFDRFKAFDKLIELVEKNSGEKEACEFYKALEASAMTSNEGCVDDEI